MPSFGEMLASFKASEEPENIVAILEDDELQNGMIAWKSVEIRYKAASDCTLKDPVAQWNWLWAQVSYDATIFGVVAGSKAQDVGRLITRLIGLRLIYPDGTVHRLARQYLQSKIMSKLKQVSPAPRGRPPAQSASSPTKETA
jgi:hypothetical protein